MVDEACVFDPPCELQVPDTTLSGTDSALSAPDSDDGSSDSSSESSSPTYSGDVPRPCLVKVKVTMLLSFMVAECFLETLNSFAIKCIGTKYINQFLSLVHHILYGEDMET